MPAPGRSRLIVFSSARRHRAAVNPAMVLARLVGVAYPLAILAATVWRRAGRRRHPGEDTDPEAVSASQLLPRLKKKELRARVGAGEDPAAFDLRSCDLTAMDLTGRDMSGVDLTRARLRGARLRGACLRGATLAYADLSQADLAGADLSTARLLEADLTGANLSGADLATARGVEMAALARARYTNETRWPTGFDPAVAGAVLVSDRSATRR